MPSSTSSTPTPTRRQAIGSTRASSRRCSRQATRPKGIELGVEIAQRAKKITGRPTSFGASQTGVYGAVGWIALYDSVDQVQKAEEALAADKGFAELLDKEASKAYLAGVSTQTLHRRVI